MKPFPKDRISEYPEAYVSGCIDLCWTCDIWNLLEVKVFMSYFGAIKNVNILHNVQAQNRHNHHTAKQRRGDRLHHGCDGGHLQSVDVLAEIEPFFGYTACT